MAERAHRTRPMSRLATRWRIAYASSVRYAFHRSSVFMAGLFVAATASAIACADPQAPARAPQKEDGVPANSLSDARLHGEEEKPKTDKPSSSSSGDAADPTQPYTTRVGEAPPP